LELSRGGVSECSVRTVELVATGEEPRPTGVQSGQVGVGEREVHGDVGEVAKLEHVIVERVRRHVPRLPPDHLRAVLLRPPHALALVLSLEPNHPPKRVIPIVASVLMERCSDGVEDQGVWRSVMG